MSQQVRESVRRPLPPKWEIEWGVIETVSRTFGVDRAEMTPRSRLLEDLLFDSIDVASFVMELEERFEITLPDSATQGWFVNHEVTLRSLAELVVDRWGTGQADRARWRTPKPSPPAVASVPMTQLGGTCSPEEWLDGQLFESLGCNREGCRQFRRRTDGMRCVRVPGAEVVVGNPNSTAPDDQKPAHPVEVSDFLIDAEPVSNLAFCRFLNSVDAPAEVVLEWCGVSKQDKRQSHLQIGKGVLSRSWSPIRGTEHLSMMLVSWYGANAYSLWANRQDWRLYRAVSDVPGSLRQLSKWNGRPPRPELLATCLPSEAQWEYAARGVESVAFPWGDVPSTPILARVGQHQIGVDYTPETIPSAGVNEELGKSPFGLHHMAGNVWQWCRDWYSATFYSTAEATKANPQNGRQSNARSERGGSWVGPEELASSSYRRGRPPATRGRCLGFRCVGCVADLP